MSVTEEKKYTREEHEAIATETAREARLEIRDAFQARHPHYTPRPGAPIEAWEAWTTANRFKHGPIGFAERFPRGLPHFMPQDDHGFLPWTDTRRPPRAAP